MEALDCIAEGRKLVAGYRAIDLGADDAAAILAAAMAFIIRQGRRADISEAMAIAAVSEMIAATIDGINHIEKRG